MNLRQRSIPSILFVLLALAIVITTVVFLSDIWNHQSELHQLLAQKQPVGSLAYGLFVSLAVFFVLGCVATLTLAHSPLLGPVRGLGKLSASFNGLLDQQRMNERELSEKNRRLSQQQQLLDTAGRVALFGGWSVEMESGVIYWSNLVCDIFEVPRGTQVNTVDEAIQFYAPEYRDRVWHIYSRCFDFEEPFDDELVIITANDKRRWARVTGEATHDEAGALIRLHGAFQDITARKESEKELECLSREREADLRRAHDQLIAELQTRTTLINSLPANIAMLDADSDILDVNEHWRDFATDNDLPDPRAGVGQNYLAVCERAARNGDMEARQVADGLRKVLAGERETFDLEYPCHSPEKQRWFSACINRLERIGTHGPEPGAVLMHIDITERRRAEERLNRLAFEDPLTGMLSRSGFTQALDTMVDTENIQFRGTVVLLDVINLRQVNDAHGFDVGDQLLQQIGVRLSEAAGAAGRVGRTGGDEFMVYLEINNERHKLEAVFETPFMIAGLPIETEARFGYTELNEQTRPVEQLLREAELALFQGAGRQKGEQWACYTATLDADNRERLALTQDLRVAIEQDQLELHFQPKVDMRTGRVLAAEALLRWHHPEQGMVSPGLFIPIAEQSQLIGPIGDWVIETACRHLKQWQYDGLDPVQIAVNVSLAQFRLGDFPRAVSETLEHHNLTSDALSLEITESVFAHEEEGLLENLNKLHAMGVRLSLDDFGTGYSSLLYLQEYPFDEIKIDKGFVSRMLDDNYSQEIVRTVIGVAGMINADLVAEGVETAQERDTLLALGCHVAQGFYYSKPLPAGEFRSLIVSGGFLPQG